MNRFFYSCPLCLFKCTMEAPGRYAPSTQPLCPLCDKRYLKLLGATKGVLREEVLCNTLCTWATGQSCECSCGGKNHGRGIVVEVCRDVITLPDSFPTRHLGEVRAKYDGLCDIMRQIKQALPDEVKEARARMRTGQWVSDRALWMQAHTIAERFKGVWKSQDYRHRMNKARALLAEFQPAAALAPAPRLTTPDLFLVA